MLLSNNITVILQADVAAAEKAINKLVTATLNQNQLDALVSLFSTRSYLAL